MEKKERYYVNQLDYPDTEYCVNLAHPEDTTHRYLNTVKNSGSALCAAAMLLEELTGWAPGIEALVTLAYQGEASLEIDTNLEALAKEMVESFDLRSEVTDDVFRVEDWLEKGGRGIALTSGTSYGKKGIFSDVVHSVYLADYDPERGEILILDPSWTPEKYKTEERAKMVREEGHEIWVKPTVLGLDTRGSHPAFYLFEPTF